MASKTYRFLPRDALVHSAVLRLHIVRPSVRLSACLSVTLLDQDHIGWKSWKLIARSLSPTPSLFVQVTETVAHPLWTHRALSSKLSNRNRTKRCNVRSSSFGTSLAVCSLLS